MASGERVGGGQRPRASGDPLGGAPARERSSARAASVVVPFPRRISGGRLDPLRLAPSARSLLIAAAVLAGAVLSYVVARETSTFSVDEIRIEGAEPALARSVDRALATTHGTSLLTVDLDAAREAVEAIPAVASARLDRAFPHVLAVEVVPERPVAVIRQGAGAYLVSARGRVVATVERGEERALARIWVPSGSVTLEPGAHVVGDLRQAVAAVAPVAGRRLPSRVAAAASTPNGLVLRLRSGLELRLGTSAGMGLKLLVARRVIPLLQPDTLYLDVSVPERPVGGTTLDSQVEVDSSISTGA